MGRLPDKLKVASVKNRAIIKKTRKHSYSAQTCLVYQIQDQDTDLEGGTGGARPLYTAENLL